MVKTSAIFNDKKVFGCCTLSASVPGLSTSFDHEWFDNICNMMPVTLNRGESSKCYKKTAHNIKFSIKDGFGKCEQIRSL